MKLFIDAQNRQCARAALAEGSLLHALSFFPEEESITGNIYLGRVIYVDKDVSAAFVDIGLAQNGFLPLMPESPLRQGEEILVMAEKLFEGGKGPRLTHKLSLPGRYAVLFAGKEGVRVSRKVKKGEVIRRLKEGATPFVAEGCAVTLRTAAAEAPESVWQAELSGLSQTYADILQKGRVLRAPALLHSENKLLRQLREYLKEGPEEVVCSLAAAEEVKNYLAGQGYAGQVTVYEAQWDMFAFYGLQADFQRVFQRKIWLSSGAFVTVEQTEALVAVDVNSGKAKKTGDHTFAHQINLEAAHEILRQIRLRCLGGIIIVDFINMAGHIGEKELADVFEAPAAMALGVHALGFTRLGLLELSVRRTEKPVSAARHFFLTQSK